MNGDDKMVKIFCSNCGKPIFVPDGKTTVFCTECGTKLNVPAPAVETPKVETPVVETPVLETPKVEAPVAEKTEAFFSETPKVEPPVVEAPKAEAPHFEAPKPVDRPAPAPQPAQQPRPRPAPTVTATATAVPDVPAEEKPKKKKTGLIIGIIAGAVVLLAALAAAFIFLMKPGMDYTAAQKLLEDKSYDEAIAAFEKLGTYNDSQAKADEARLGKAIKLVSSGKFDKAAKTLKEIEDEDIDLTKLNEALGEEIAKLASEGDEEGVLDAIDAMGDYVDNADEAVAAGVKALIAEKSYYSASSLISALSDEEAIKDMSVIRAAVTTELQTLVDAGDIDEARNMAYALSDYIDDIDGICYKAVSAAVEAGDYAKAKGIIEKVYWDLKEPAKAVVDKANALIEAGELDEALELAEKTVGEYSEYKVIAYAVADKYFENEDYEKAAELFDELGWYEDSYDRAKAARSKIALSLVDKEGMTAEEYVEVYEAVKDAGADQDVIDAFIVKWAKDALEDGDTELASKLYYSVYLPDSAEEGVYAVVLENLSKTATVTSDGEVTANEDEITAIKSVLDLFGYYYESVPEIKDYLTNLSGGKSFSNAEVVALWDVSGMKDVLTSELGISGAIVGNWESADGESTIEMTERGNGSFNFNYELPAGDLPSNTYSWYIGGHDLILTDSDGADIQAFVRITVTDLEHITVYCYNTDTTVELTKQS